MALIPDDRAGGVGEDAGFAPVLPVLNAAPTDAVFTQGTAPTGCVVLVDDGSGALELYARNAAGTWAKVTDATA